MKIPEHTKNSLLYIICAVIITYGVFLYLQNSYQETLTKTIVEEQKGRQEYLATSVARNIESDLDSILQRIKNLALAPYFTFGSSVEKETLQNKMRETLLNMHQIIPVDELFIVFKNHTMLVTSAGSSKVEAFGLSAYSGSKDNYFSQFLNQSLAEQKTLFSVGYRGQDNGTRIAITTPIFREDNREDNDEYLGFVGVSTSANNLIGHYGNIDDLTKQRFVFYDKNATILVAVSNSSIGTNFFSYQNQKGLPISEKDTINQLFQKVLSGQMYTAEYDIGQGPRVVTGSPIIIGGIPTYFLNIITPLSEILSPINELTNKALLLNIVLIVAFTLSVLYLVWNLMSWGNKLDNKVKIRTQELEYANKSLLSKSNELQRVNSQLIEINKKLEINDKVQKEFVNVAAHELRTPIQSIMGYSELSTKLPEKRVEYNNMIKKNVERLSKLSDDILEVARIESGTMQIEQHDFNIVDLLIESVNDLKARLKGKHLNGNISNVNIDMSLPQHPVIVKGDRSKIFQVISNLLCNAEKFTDSGTITVSVIDDLSKKSAIVSVEDTGKGVDKEMVPKLFTKFSAKSEHGTGLGLYICKNIVEAHGGSIWFDETKNGAKFSFSVPLA
ncbi:MAG: sensor histidine kinase [Nitrososphaeraceae archaeon]